MFLKEALESCSQLQSETAAFYDALSASGDQAKIARWRGAAECERRRAAFLTALASVCTALEDEGPFLVQVSSQLEAFRRALESANWRHATSTEHSECRCVDQLESFPRARLNADLLEIAEPELRRAVRMIVTELRNLGRGADVRKSRPDAKPMSAPACG